MAAARLEVLLSADGKQLADTMKKAVGDVNKLDNELTTLQPSFEKVNQSLTKTSNQLKTTTQAFKPFTSALQLSDKSLAKLPVNSNRAGDSLMNLGRIAQDAPFGFIGITNNINPLLESFQRLKKETGSTKGALKSLVAGLGGAGGLGFAVSVASSLMLVFGDKLFGVSKKAKESEDAFRAMASTFADQASKLTALVGIVQSVNSTYSDKAKALQAINEEYKTYLKNLGIEKVDVGNLSQAYDKLIDSLLRQAVVKGLQEEISKTIEETARKIIQIEVAEKKRVAAVDAATNATKTQLTTAQRAAKEYAAYNKTIGDGIIAQQSSDAATKALIESTNDYDSIIKRVKGDLQAQLKPLLSLTSSFDDLGITLKDLNKKEVGEKKTVIKPRIFVENPILIKPQSYFASLKNEASKMLSDLQEEVNKLTKKNPILIRAERVQAIEKARGAEFFGALGIASADENAPKSLLNDAQKAAVNLANVMNKTVMPAFEGLFTAIRAGENPMKAFFASLGQAVEDLLQQLLQAALQAAILSAITGGGTTFGSAFKSLLGFRAEGGPVFANKPYVVGERGPELFIPQGGGKIIPNNEMNSGLSGITGPSNGFIAETVLRGRDISLLLSRQGQYNNRNV